ncbi:MAG: hypothetical protein CVU95_10855 [Firmicutes bacterium HGW-Firmicutes-2]|jgi:hypothetical protein|nr:MAG: hypothetical protein CVU95_10855 [Firmicutes bacterium HGW-Firmicutes-2]
MALRDQKINRTLLDQEKHEAFNKTIFTMMPHTFSIKTFLLVKTVASIWCLFIYQHKKPTTQKKDIFETKDKIKNILEKNHPYLLLDIILEETSNRVASRAELNER